MGKKNRKKIIFRISFLNFYLFFFLFFFLFFYRYYRYHFVSILTISLLCKMFCECKQSFPNLNH